jgi:endoglucanase
MSLFRSTDCCPAAWLVFCSAACAQTPSAQEPPTVPTVLLGGTPTIDRGPPPPSLRHNQLGYVPSFPKWAAMVTAETTPLDWQLVDGAGRPLAQGKTQPFGEDGDSGDKLQQIDFSAYRTPASSVRLRVGKDESTPFDLRPDLYRKLAYDALAYFYHARSGIELALPYVVEAKWARPAGHLSDQKVQCMPNSGCTYTLDVRGGWYDAGDHGKYVVNGGISVWTLLNQYERTKYLAPARLAEFGDGKLKIPEHDNRVPDLLDEARWELAFLLKMQVPEGNDRAGMVHHKMHDEQWTAIGTPPVTDTNAIKLARYLHPPSTAATLNLAATAAQCSRIYREFDAKFADQCLGAAERAWQAALRWPNVYASPDDTRGGGAYEDKSVVDEFYWAASELFITTKKPEYQDALLKSPFYLRIPERTSEDGKSGAPSPMTWQQTAALGTLSLGIVPNGLGQDELTQARKQVTDRADWYLMMLSKQGYRVPFQADDQGKFPWGSNSFVINNALLLALAHDFTGKPEYLYGAAQAMDYLLGRNGMGQSYITGYGSRPLANPHHRFWAHQLSPTKPSAPPGCLSGGPNSDVQDPIAQQAGLPGCKPQKCFIDHLDAYSVNEITINWNAPLAWVTAWLDEKAQAGK